MSIHVIPTILTVVSALFSVIILLTAKTGHPTQDIYDPRRPPEEGDDGGVEEDEKQANGTTTYSVAHPAVKLPTILIGSKAEEIEQLIASGGYSKEEEEEVWGALIEMVKRFNSLKEMQRKA